jgi:predicted Zn-dependent protease
MSAQGGKESLDDVIAAARELKASEEFAALLSVVRRHAGDALQSLGQRIVGESDEPLSMMTLLNQTLRDDETDAVD